ncbi:MAG: YjbQ family protein [Methanobacteriota archaeon]|nr:MAG: YjbQ family protein [Euryarchaeota archaeon]
MPWYQKVLQLAPKPRGFHVVTTEIVRQLPELEKINVGLVHFFILHTSASLTLNENVSPDVRADMEAHINTIVPENAPYFTHTYEGPDDMPAHIKASLFGSGLVIPIRNGKLLLGTWQGIYLGEHRDRAHGRRIVVTIFGE